MGEKLAAVRAILNETFFDDECHKIVSRLNEIVFSEEELLAREHAAKADVPPGPFRIVIERWPQSEEELDGIISAIKMQYHLRSTTVGPDLCEELRIVPYGTLGRGDAG